MVELLKIHMSSYCTSYKCNYTSVRYLEKVEDFDFEMWVICRRVKRGRGSRTIGGKMKYKET